MAEKLKMNEEKVAIMEHTITHSANGLYCGDSPDMQYLVKHGLMGSQGKTGFCPDEYFYITPLGRKVLSDMGFEKLGTTEH